MTPVRRKRLMMIAVLVVGVGAGTGLVLKSLGENMSHFVTPSEVQDGKVEENRKFRLGGMVKDNSVIRSTESLLIRFDVTDNADTVTVEYTGILPDLFREGQGVITSGKLRSDGVFVADEVLAKHDENYMPPEVAASMKPLKQSSK